MSSWIFHWDLSNDVHFIKFWARTRKLHQVKVCRHKVDQVIQTMTSSWCQHADTTQYMMMWTNQMLTHGRSYVHIDDVADTSGSWRGLCTLTCLWGGGWPVFMDESEGATWPYHRAPHGTPSISPPWWPLLYHLKKIEGRIRSPHLSLVILAFHHWVAHYALTV